MTEFKDYLNFVGREGEPWGINDPDNLYRCMKLSKNTLFFKFLKSDFYINKILQYWFLNLTTACHSSNRLQEGWLGFVRSHACSFVHSVCRSLGWVHWEGHTGTDTIPVATRFAALWIPRWLWLWYGFIMYKFIFENYSILPDYRWLSHVEYWAGLWGWSWIW